jgi:multidrug efflux pump subunit AcrA (membrane-fusion protein)
VIDRDYIMKYSLPAKEKSLKEAQVKQGHLLAKARKTLGPAAAQKREALAKMRHDQGKAVRRLERLRKDRAGLTLRSPVDGVVYHGKFEKGRWTLSDALEGKLVPRGTVSPDEVLMTVVSPRPVVVHLAIDEKDVHLFKPGARGTARALFNPERKLPARVVRVGPVPSAPGKYDAVVALDLGPKDEALMPGMAVSVKFMPYSKKDALLVPAKAVHEEDDRYVVHVAKKNGKPETREVTPGKTEDGQTEILSGLREGEEILVERPGPKALKKVEGPEPKKTGGAD